MRPDETVTDAHKWQTMSIASRGDSAIQTTMPRWQPRMMNQTKDISGAQPRKLHGRYVKNRPDFAHDARDIDGTAPQRLHKEMKKPDFSLAVDDIDGARPRPSTFRSERHVDPLAPSYQLPAVKAEPAVRLQRVHLTGPMAPFACANLYTVPRAR